MSVATPGQRSVPSSPPEWLDRERGRDPSWRSQALAAVSALAVKAPERLSGLVHPHPDGTFTVHLYDRSQRGEWIKVLVSIETDAGRGPNEDPGALVRLIEKAYFTLRGPAPKAPPESIVEAILGPQGL